MIATPLGASAVPMADRQVRPGLPAVSAAAAAPARVTLAGGPLLQVQVGPSQVGPGAWTFTLERRSGDSWVRAGDYRTTGTKEEAALPVAAGTYRVVVPAQHGYQVTTSKSSAYAPTPDITVAGHGALEVKVGPNRDWQVTLERKTDQGWSRVETLKSRGLKRMVFSVDRGTYRVRTAANGRFPAFTGDPFDFAPTAPPGPIPYGFLDAAFSDAPGVAMQRSLTVVPRAASSSCASVLSPSPDIGLKVATGLINYIPYVGGALSSTIDNQAANAQSNAEEACISAQFATINAQLAYQESQIESLQNQLSAAELEISNEFADAAKVNVQQDQKDFYNSVSVLAQCASGGLFYDFMMDFGLWSGCSTPSSATIQGVATSGTFAAQSTFGGANQTAFNFALENVAGNDVSGCSESDCQKFVQPYPSSQLSKLQQALTMALSASLTSSRTRNTNTVPLFDDYNQYLAAYYQQAVVGIQAAFTMEYLVNQLNYYNAGANSPIDSLGLVPGTYYSYQNVQTALGSKPSATEQAKYYNRAQYALAQVYAARMNHLYQDTIGYIVTDAPVGNQAWPSSTAGNKINDNIDYAKNVGTNVTVESSYGGLKYSTPMELLPTAATQGATWTDNAVLYQYFGLQNAGTCYASLVQWNQKNGTAVQGKSGTWYPTATPSRSELAGGAYNTLCPPILTTATGGAVTALPTSSTLTSCASYAAPMPGSNPGSCYDGNTLAPYYAADGGLPEATSSVLTNLVLCNGSDPALTWFQVGSANAGNAAGLTSGDWALTCGNWAAPVGPGYPSSAFPGSSPPSGWGDTAEYLCGSAGYCSGTSPTSFFGPFYATNYYCYSIAYCSTGVPGYTFNSFYAPGYYGPQTQGSLPYVPPSTTVLLNIGGTGQSTTMAITTPNCYSNNWTTGATVNTGSGCSVTFDPVSQQGRYGSATANLAALAVSLPNSATGSQTGGFSLPMTVGTVYGVPTQASDTGTTCSSDCTLAGVWIASNTSVADVGYYAPASTVNSSYTGFSVSQLLWQQNGYITVADGSCWNINVGRTANNVGTISFNQITPGSLCASTVTSPVTETAPLPVITAASPPSSGTVGAAYGPYTFTASGSPAPTWSVASGALPAGVTLSSAGVLSGTPTTGGSSTFTVQATNTAGSATSSSITIAALPAGGVL